MFPIRMLIRIGEGMLSMTSGDIDFLLFNPWTIMITLFTICLEISVERYNAVSRYNAYKIMRRKRYWYVSVFNV